MVMVVAVVADEVVEEDEGGRRMVALDKAVTEDLARVWPAPGVVPETARWRGVGVPEEVVGLVPGAVPDAAGRVEVDGWRSEAVRVRRLVGGGGSGPELPLSR
jgi:hypothetical protein